MPEDLKIDPEAALPQILAPAGNKDAFLAAIAAGTDAIYCGLKRYSARMEAVNFAEPELASLTRLAHERQVKVFVTVNTLVTPGEINEVAGMIDRLDRVICPDALIVQDLAVVELARRIGFRGELILSTLANVSFPEALNLISKDLKIDRVVIPRELNIDEIRAMARACPKELALEVFVHGALCYGVSGRCYWSSFLGGKSGLRGRCVQPCRRIYRQGEALRKDFSCQDLSVDVLVKVLSTIPQIRNWKIEGRKKGPHYVYYTVRAYRLLRDHGKDPQAKKDALSLLARSLGRTGTHYNLLPQRPQNPVAADGRTASGLFVGKIQGGGRNPYFTPREELYPADVLRIGSEDHPWHEIQKVSRFVPQKGRIHFVWRSKMPPPKGAPVFLIDRREKALDEMLKELAESIPPIGSSGGGAPGGSPELPAPHTRPPSRSRVIEDSTVYRSLQGKNKESCGIWLSLKNGSECRQALPSERIWWWLPPVIWPEQEKSFCDAIESIVCSGGRRFVLNQPWQSVFFKNPREFNLWAGPFCNVSNPVAAESLAALGFSGVIVSPELKREDYLAFPGSSPLPLGIVLSGNWPLCVARTASADLKLETPFTSPKGEQSWVQKNDANYWVYPNWCIDLTMHRKELEAAGYSLFIGLIENVPDEVSMKSRPGRWNWESGLA
ncbi:MAG: U32 family peptidase [Desulfobacteraceae bacterium]|nr:MAG: U32 family peptidase [Desulfobacteraceae bacterium]